MFFKAAILDILFSISMFALLAYQVYCLMQTHLVPFLSRQLQEERDDHMHIIEKQRLLVSTHHRIQNQIYNQKNILTLLERNVQRWYQSMMDERNEHDIQQKKLVISIREKRAQQVKQMELDKKISLLLEPALEETRKTLEKKYTGNEGKTALLSVLNSIARDNNS